MYLITEIFLTGNEPWDVMEQSSNVHCNVMFTILNAEIRDQSIISIKLGSVRSVLKKEKSHIGPRSAVKLKCVSANVYWFDPSYLSCPPFCTAACMTSW